MQRDYGMYANKYLKNANVVKHLWIQAIKLQLFGNVFQNHLDLLMPGVQAR